MSKAVVYLRSATGNQKQIARQRAHCRSYLRERDLAHVETITDFGHPTPGLSNLLDAAARTGATEVVVSELSRLGRTPLAYMNNFDAIEEAGLTIHVAGGTLSGPVSDECTRDMMYEFATIDAQRLGYDDTQQD